MKYRLVLLITVLLSANLALASPHSEDRAAIDDPRCTQILLQVKTEQTALVSPCKKIA